MPTAQDSRKLRYVTGTVWIATLCAILFAALRPFHVPSNDVSWVPDRDALAFGSTGTVLSLTEFDFTALKSPFCSLEIWFDPALVWGRGTILSFYGSSNAAPLSVQQDYTDLVLQRGPPSYRNAGRPPQLKIKDLFRNRHILLTVMSDGKNVAVYFNGRLIAAKNGFGLTVEDLSGRLIIANSAMRRNSWSGVVQGLAIYNRILTASEVEGHYEDWMHSHRPHDTNNGEPAALYVFREKAGAIIHDMGTSGTDLYIPAKFLMVNQLFLEAPWNEMYGDRYYFNNCLFNIAGFIPFGFVGAAYVSSFWRVKRPVLVVILMGSSISLSIEIIQAYLPTRFSGVSDIITNTAGAIIGAWLYRSGVLRVEKIVAGWRRRLRRNQWKDMRHANN